MFGRRILVLAPHPDDEVVGCAAAIARVLRNSSQERPVVLAAFLTTGVPAAERLWPWQRMDYARRVARRQQEARLAAGLLGIRPLCFQTVPTRQLKEFLQPTLERLVGLLREQGADTLWTPAYEGGHQDHDVTNFLASTLRDLVEVWEFSAYNYSGGRVHSQQFPTPNGTERQIALDGDEQQRKRQLLAIYRSERPNLRHVRVEAEVFRPLARYDYSRPPHPGKLFYQRFQWVPRHPRVDHTRPEEVCQAIARFSVQQPGARGEAPKAKAHSVTSGRS